MAKIITEHIKETNLRYLNWVIIPSDLASGLEGGKYSFEAIKAYFSERNDELFNSMKLDTINQPHSSENVPADPSAKNISDILNLQTEVCRMIYSLRNNHIFPLVISGDHSSVVGIVAGISKAHVGEKIGIVYIDAHADLHSPYTTPSGNMHGMSLAIACKMDHKHLTIREPNQDTILKWEKLKNLSGNTSKIDPSNIVFCAVRETEPQESEVIQQYGIQNISVEELRRIGTKESALKMLSVLKDCKHIYVSFDIDSLDPEVAPGTGTPVEKGLTILEAIELNTYLIRDKRVCCWELTELNPKKDKNNSTVKIAGKLISSVVETLLTHY